MQRSSARLNQLLRSLMLIISPISLFAASAGIAVEAEESRCRIEGNNILMRGCLSSISIFATWGMRP
jgi:hypothetical protein